MILRRGLLLIPLILTGAATAGGRGGLAQNTPVDREAAYRANNVGVARLEQYNYVAAVESFRSALQAAPDLGVTHLNLAIALFYSGETEAALKEAQAAAAQVPAAPQPQYLLGLIGRSLDRQDEAVRAFQKVLAIDRTDVGAKVNLAQVYTQQRDYAQALPLLREALGAEPYNATASYALAVALTRSGSSAEGRAAMQQFEALRGTPYARTYSQMYLEQGRYAEAIASTGAEADLVDTAPPAVTFVDTTAAVLPSSDSTPGNSSGSGSVTLLDVDHDGSLDILTTGQAGTRLYRNAGRRFADLSQAAGLSATAAGPGLAAVAGDYDNDGRPDLLVLDPRGGHLLHQGADGRFEERRDLPAFAHTSRSAAFVDVDHDGDLDIFVVGGNQPGVEPAPPAPNQLLRNNGDGTFTDITAEAGVAAGDAAGIAVVPTDFDNRRDIDLLVLRRNALPSLFQNARNGSFRDVAKDAKLPGAARYTAVAAGDINKDGYPDFFFGRADTPGVFAISDGQSRFTITDGPPDSSGAIAAQFIDYDNDGILDLFVLRGDSARIFRGLGDRWVDMTERAGLNAPALHAPAGTPFQAAASGDLDADGDTDVVVRLQDGGLRLWRNEGGSRNRSVHVRLEGNVSNRSGLGSKIDLRAGSLKQRIETSAAVPSPAPADILFGMGNRGTADVVRVLWPSGTLQAETTPAAATPGKPAAVTIAELNRKPSSCPFLYTWNGTRFEFVTDFMGGGEMGDWVAPSVWNQPDPDEYVRIRGDQLKPLDGRYEIRITNELEEALFVDQLQLMAVDHPADEDVFPNEGLKGPPRPAFKLTSARNARPPVRAIDEHGHDVLPAITSLDRRYPDDFGLLQIRGYAASHELTLDLGPIADPAVLLLTGWTDYAFSNDNVAASQSRTEMSPPSLQVKDAKGSWRTVIDEIGFPVGRPQTVVVNLAGKFLSSSREVRILTNMRIYWDQVQVATSDPRGQPRMTRLDPLTAVLRWRGFSAETKPDGREPLAYDYQRVSTALPWKMFVGRYTREGDVGPLVGAIDDMFVISRPGDEIALSFDAAALPSLPAGWTRTFLLYADGYSKEMNPRSASQDTVTPLPFRAMTRYPYGTDERYPDTAAHRQYMERYNTRVVSTPLPSIDAAALGGGVK